MAFPQTRMRRLRATAGLRGLVRETDVRAGQLVLPLFARGSKVVDPIEYPPADEIVLAWKDVKASLCTAMEDVSEGALSAPGPEKVPSFDGKLSGLVSFFAFHETYHVGQACYLRRWLGHGQVIG